MLGGILGAEMCLREGRDGEEGVLVDVGGFVERELRAPSAK